MGKIDYIKNGERVGCKGYPLSNEQIKKFYLEDDLTLKQIGEKLNISHWTVLSRLKKMNVRKNTRHLIDHSAFDKFTQESCYWAGFIAADGSVHKDKKRIEIEIKTSDEKHLINLCDYIKRDHKVWRRERKKKEKIYKASAISIVSENIVININKKFSVTSNKSKTLKPPTNIPEDLIKHFIRGYIDGDGSIGWHKHNNKPRLSICSGSKEFLEWLVDNIKENIDTGNPTIRKEKNKDLYTIEFMGKQTIPILDWVYKDSTDQIRLDRKYKRYIKYCNILGA